MSDKAVVDLRNGLTAKRMTWREKCVIRILLLVVRIVGGVDQSVSVEVGALDNHIRCGALED